MSEDQKKQLQTQLWNIANELRGKMDADEFRDYILGFIFYKYLSEKMHLYADKVLATDGVKYIDLNEDSQNDKHIIDAVKKAALDKLGYFLKPNELFHYVATKGSKSGNLIEDLDKILNDIENSTMGTDSEDDFDKLFSELDLNATKLGKTVTARNELIAKVLIHLDKIDFMLEDAKVDVLGDAYEYLISQFASGAGKKAGEFYTPQEVSTVLAKLVTIDKKQLKDVYDPTCGSGSLLLRVARQVENVGHFYGQEMNNTTYNLARMNMILHDVHFSKFDLQQEDTLEHPQHLDKRFEAIVANPPFSAKWSASPLFMQDDRFSQYGKLAPSSKADYAFIQHMIYQLADNGTMATLMPLGVLFRGNSEGHIREYLIKEKNYLDAVIGLPSNLFFGVSIPACILVFKKCRTNPNDILFIDASKHFEKVKNQNKLREEDIEKIINTYKERKAIDKYSYAATLDEVKENDYNLNIPRYVDTFEEEEPIDLDKVTSEIKKVNVEISQIDKKISNYCRTLKIPTPTGCNLPLLKKYKKGIMQRIFAQEARFKDEDGNDFPSWKKNQLSGLTSTPVSDGPHSTPQFLNDGVPFLSVDNLVDNKIDISNLRYISQKDHLEFSKKCKPQKGDILLGKAASVGMVAIADFDFEFNVWSPIAVIRLESYLNPRFFYFAFQTDFIKRQIKRLINSSSQENLGMADIKKITFLVPDNKEQNIIADFLTSIDDKINLVEKELDQAKQFKKSLLQQMFV